MRSCFSSDHLGFVQKPLRTPRPAPYLMRAQSWLVGRRTKVTGFLSLIQEPGFRSNDDENTHILMVAQAQAVSSLSEPSEFSKEFLSSQLVLINSDRKHSALIVAPQRLYLIQMLDIKLTVITNVHLKLHLSDNG